MQGGVIYNFILLNDLIVFLFITLYSLSVHLILNDIKYNIISFCLSCVPLTGPWFSGGELCCFAFQGGKKQKSAKEGETPQDSVYSRINTPHETAHSVAEYRSV